MNYLEVTDEQKAVLRADGWLDSVAAAELKKEIARAQDIAMTLQVNLGKQEGEISAVRKLSDELRLRGLALKGSFESELDGIGEHYLGISDEINAVLEDVT